MRQLCIWPEFQRGISLGQRYDQINQILASLAQELNIDLWTLDAVWWVITSGVPLEPPPPPPPAGSTDDSQSLPTGVQRFTLERDLQDFLLGNWNQMDIGKEWMIYQVDGDDEAGYEFPTDVGRIDLVARHRREPRLLVVELRDQSSDATIGQVLRYKGWVQKHIAKPHEHVEGLIIAHESPDAIRYARAPCQM